VICGAVTESPELPELRVNPELRELMAKQAPPERRVLRALRVFQERMAQPVLPAPMANAALRELLEQQERKAQQEPRGPKAPRVDPETANPHHYERVCHKKQ